MQPVILLGLGFTTRRLAKRLLLRGIPTFAAVRNADRFRDLSSIGLRFTGFPENATLIHTIPPLAPDESRVIHEWIRRVEPRRVVYISSTGVYGGQTHVDETTEPAPSDKKGHLRIDEESWVKKGDWNALILRPAAIYGPGRGIHIRVFEGLPPRTGPAGITSRIHVDDLAAVLEAATLSELTGSWPLADHRPCDSAELAAWCGRLLGKPLSPAWHDNAPAAGRQVNGRGICKLLKVRLAFPTFESGILACLAREKAC